MLYDVKKSHVLVQICFSFQNFLELSYIIPNLILNYTFKFQRLNLNQISVCLYL